VAGIYARLRLRCNVSNKPWGRANVMISTRLKVVGNGRRQPSIAREGPASTCPGGSWARAENNVRHGRAEQTMPRGCCPPRKIGAAGRTRARLRQECRKRLAVRPRPAPPHCASLTFSITHTRLADRGQGRYPVGTSRSGRWAVANNALGAILSLEISMLGEENPRPRPLRLEPTRCARPA